jgi:hypothetical protein
MPEIHWPECHSLITPEHGPSWCYSFGAEWRTSANRPGVARQTSATRRQDQFTRDEQSLCPSLQCRFYSEDLLKVFRGFLS